MSLLHKAITLSGACAIGLTLAFAAPAAAEDAKPINFRAVGGAVLGGTWNVGLTGVGKLVNDRYPGSAINVLQGASVSNPLRLEQNAADVTLTQTFNTVAARDGKAPYKKPLKNVASLANMNDTSRLSIIVSADLPVNTFDELMEKKLPVRLDRGAKGTLHNVVGAMLLAEYGYTYDDITKWGGAHTAVSANDRVGMFQDGTLNAYLTLGPGQQMIVDTGNVLGFESTVAIDIQQVKGLKNKFFGGEGFFNTVLTGPGKIWLQTMPISGVAMSIYPFLPTKGNG